jgi:hypothetical protein
VALTEADISQNLTISILMGTVETNFIQIMCEKRDRQARNVYKDFLKKSFVRGCGHFSEVKYLTLHR